MSDAVDCGIVARYAVDVAERSRASMPESSARPAGVARAFALVIVAANGLAAERRSAPWARALNNLGHHT